MSGAGQPEEEDLSASSVHEPPPQPKRPPLLLHAGLFLATFVTTTAAGAINVHKNGNIAPINDGLSYSIPLMLILLCHELGHYVVARLHGVDASLPFFIPFPPWFGLGTMGAVIGMSRATTDRKKLIDIGAAGPLAGLAVAIPVILYGLSRSQVAPLPPVGVGEVEGNSLLYAWLKYLSKGVWLPDGERDVFLHPTAWAGWAGLLVTMINLLPIGQLDGGHVATAYFGDRYNAFARRLHGFMPLLAVGVFVWVYHVAQLEMGEHWRSDVGLLVARNAALPWLGWFALVWGVRRLGGGANHPPVDPKPLPRSRRALFWLMALVFVAIFMPVPFRQSVKELPPDTGSVAARLP